MAQKLSDMTLDNSMALTVKRSEPGLGAKKLEDFYDKDAKLVFLFDRSSSMMAKILGKKQTECYQFTGAILGKVKDEAETVFAAQHESVSTDMNGIWSLSNRQRLMYQLVEPSTGKVTLSDDEIKNKILKEDMMSELGIAMDYEKYRKVAHSRMDVVKKLAKQEIQKRLDKYPNANIAVVNFDGVAQLEFNGGTREELMRCIDLLSPKGGTATMQALHLGLDACRQRPSIIGLHHFILVTDGCDYLGNLRDWIPTLKASGVILDYIHIGEIAANEDIKVVCDATGGEFVAVRTEDELSEKFVAAVERKCLPAPASVEV